MPMVAHRKISTRLGSVISSKPWLLHSQESGPFPTVNMAGWAPGLVKTGRRKRKCLAPHWGSNLTVQSVASRYTVYAIPSPSHTEGDGMNVACRRGKNHENYTSLRFIRNLLHLCILVSYDSCIYLLSKLHKAVLKKNISWITYIFLTIFQTRFITVFH